MGVGVMVLLALCAGGCQDPFAVFQEREGDLAPRLPASRLRTGQPLDLGAFKRDTSGEAANVDPAAAVEAVRQRQSAASVDWSLQDVRAAAIAGNLDLKVALIDPALAEQALAVERAKFDAVFSPSIRYRNDDQPTLNTTSSSQSQSIAATGQLTVPLRTGGRATVALSENYQQTNNPFVVFDQSYGLGLDASVSLPLLRGYGRSLNAASIKIAGYEADLAAAGTKLQIINVLNAAERAYWRLVAARQELEVRQKQFELAQAQVEKAKRRVNAGDAAQIEITRAESGLAQRLEGIIASETEILIAQRDLKKISNATSVGESVVNDATIIRPVTPPEATAYTFPIDALIAQAEANRMELLQSELQLLADALNIEIAMDGTQPKLNVDAGYSFDGLGTEVDRALHTLVRRKWQSWNLGISGEYAFGNEAAEATLRRAALGRLRSLATLDARKQTVRKDVLDAIDRVGSAWQRILASQQSAVLAGRTLEAETRQFDAGIRTSTDVLDAASRLADAQSSEVRALADYRIALCDLASATGTTLAGSDITWDAVPAPALSGERPWGLRTSEPTPKQEKTPR